MKPAPFDYVRPATLDEACAQLTGDPDARLVAGGQTLIPMMAMRLARPSKLIDIARLPELRGFHEEPDAIVFGAATRQMEAERSALVAQRLPLLAAALPWVGHAPTRARGTIGGTIANADPAAEIPLVLVTLEGRVRMRDGYEVSEMAARDLFIGPMTTAIPASACLMKARFPIWNERRLGVGFHEVSARKSDFAYVSAAAQVALDDSGAIARCALGIGGATPFPTRLDTVSTALQGSKPDAKHIGDAVAAAMAEQEIMRDSHASESYRRRVAVGLAGRALNDAIANAQATSTSERA
jgi:CO/xanthine dehydrogenase FAD-binding subunit